MADSPLDIYTPAAPGSLMRSAVLDRPGIYRLARRDCEIYSIQVLNAGDWSRARIMTGRDRAVWYMPSVFTGSFWLSGGLEDGLIAELSAMNFIILSINWREPDRSIV